MKYIFHIFINIYISLNSIIYNSIFEYCNNDDIDEFEILGINRENGLFEKC